MSTQNKQPISNIINAMLTIVILGFTLSNPAEAVDSSVQLKPYKVSLKLLKVPKTHFLAKSGVNYYAFDKKFQTTFLLNKEKSIVQTIFGNQTTNEAGGFFPPIILQIPGDSPPPPTPPDSDPPEEPEPEEECDPDTDPDGCECPPEFLGLDCNGEGENISIPVFIVQ